MNHPEVAKIGLGNVDERLKRSIDILVEANALPRTPTVEEIFTPAAAAGIRADKKLFYDGANLSHQRLSRSSRGGPSA